MPERSFKWNDTMGKELDGLVRSRAQVSLGVKFTVDEKVAQLRHLMARLEQDERVEMLDTLLEGYCRRCLRVTKGTSSPYCHCDDDD